MKDYVMKMNGFTLLSEAQMINVQGGGGQSIAKKLGSMCKSSVGGWIIRLVLIYGQDIVEGFIDGWRSE